jgi:hypothetical protein
VPNTAVFLSSMMSCFPSMLLRYFLSDSEMVRVVPIIIGIAFIFIVHVRAISVVKSIYFKKVAVCF